MRQENSSYVTPISHMNLLESGETGVLFNLYFVFDVLI